MSSSCSPVPPWSTRMCSAPAAGLARNHTSVSRTTALPVMSPKPTLTPWNEHVTLVGAAQKGVLVPLLA